MNTRIIENYIKLIKKEDVKIFLEKNNIFINETQLDYLYNILKNNYEDIIKEDINIFEDIKNNISLNNYNKLLDLYNKYKKVVL